MLEHYRKIIVSLLLAALIIAAFWQLKNCAFTNFDDTQYVKENRNVLPGVTGEGIIWAFTSNYADNWHPLTWMSHMLDCQLYGLKPSGHHITNLILHIINTLLLFLFLTRVTKAFWASAMVAALFAVHPLHVESVAWVAERKDVLSTFFWMTTLWAYCWYVERPKLNRYLWVLLSYALGLMAKPMIVTLPLVLLLLDYWPLARIQAARPLVKARSKTGPISNTSKALVPLVLEKVPLLALAAFSSIITMLAQKHALAPILLNIRLANALISYVVYIGEMIWPIHLAVFYPHSGPGVSWVGAIVAGLVLASCSILAVSKARKYPYLPVGWFWYLGTLVPVIGLVQVGGQAMADRYTYIPLIGLFLILVWGTRDLTDRWRRQKTFFVLAAVIVLTSCTFLTWRQVGYWRNSISLFEHTLAVTSGNWVAHNNLGLAYKEAGRVDEAIVQFQKFVKIYPCARAFNNLGDSLLLQGKIDQAIDQFKEAERLEPNSAQAHFNLGVAFSSRGDLAEALAQYQSALALDGDDLGSLNNLAYILATAANPTFRDGPKAVQLAEKANRLARREPAFMDTLAAAYAETGRFPEAIDTAQKAVNLASANGKTDLAKELEKKMHLYRNGWPYHKGQSTE